MASLWSVPDETTQRLMRRFYDNLWSGGMNKVEALREAQLSILNRRAVGEGERAYR